MEKSGEYVAGLRALANFCEEHPNLAMSLSAINVWLWTKEQAAEWARALAHHKLAKDFTGDLFVLKADFEGLKVEPFCQRNLVCSMKVVGKEKKTRQVATGYKEVEEEVDIYEWDCGSLLEEKSDGN